MRAERGRTVEQGRPRKARAGSGWVSVIFLQRGAFGKKSIRKRRDIFAVSSVFSSARYIPQTCRRPARHGPAVHLARNCQVRRPRPAALTTRRSLSHVKYAASLLFSGFCVGSVIRRAGMAGSAISVDEVSPSIALRSRMSCRVKHGLGRYTFRWRFVS